MTTDHSHSQSPAARNCSHQTIKTIEQMVDLISRTYSDCQTNAELTANLIMIAASTRAKHMALHEPELPSKYCDEVLANLSEVLDASFCMAVDFTKKVTAMDKLTPEQLLAELLRMAKDMDRKS